MEKYLMDFFDAIVAGKYGRTKITRINVAQFVEKADSGDVEAIEDFYWEWTSVLCEPEDIDMDELEDAFFAVLKK
jgi:hypothetical protein